MLLERGNKGMDSVGKAKLQFEKRSVSWAVVYHKKEVSILFILENVFTKPQRKITFIFNSIH